MDKLRSHHLETTVERIVSWYLIIIPGFLNGAVSGFRFQPSTVSPQHYQRPQPGATLRFREVRRGSAAVAGRPPLAVLRTGAGVGPKDRRGRRTGTEWSAILGERAVELEDPWPSRLCFSLALEPGCPEILVERADAGSLQKGKVVETVGVGFLSNDFAVGA